VIKLHSGCPPTVGLHSIFGGFAGGKYRNFAFLGLLHDRSSVDLDCQKTPWPIPIHLKRIYSGVWFC
jgi:hypothetical protein